MRILKLALFAIAIAAFVVAGVFWYTSRQLVAPANTTVGHPPEWLPAEPVQLSSDNGETIRGWFASVAGARAAVVLLHPVRGNRRSMLGRARFLTRNGISVLLIDLQSHGESSGERITFGRLESMDAAAAVRFVRRAAPDLPVIVLGRSLGGAAALLATPALPVDGYILEAVFPDFDSAIRNRLEMRGGLLGTALAPLYLAQLKPWLGIAPAALRPMDQLSEITAPVFVMSGEDDRRTTSADTRVLYAAHGGPKALWLVPGATHQDLHAVAGSEYEDRLLRFIDAVVTGAQ